MKNWICDDGNWEVEISAETARKAAQEYVDGCDWCPDDDLETCWVSVTVYPEGCPDESDSVLITIDPEEPECIGDHDHSWGDDSVYGHGGGVICTDTCWICGLRRKADSWAQDPSTGQQGLDAVSYAPGYDCDTIARQMGELVSAIDWSEYADEIARLADEETLLDCEIEPLISQIAGDVFSPEPNAYELRMLIEGAIDEQIAALCAGQCIEVTRSDAGCYEIPGAGTTEDWDTVRADMAQVGDCDPLAGWGQWTRVYHCIDEHGAARWYFCG